MALPSFLKHVAVLSDAGLISTTKRGRVRECRLNRDALDATAAWIAEHQRTWETRLDALDRALAASATTPRKDPS